MDIFWNYIFHLLGIYSLALKLYSIVMILSSVKNYNLNQQIWLHLILFMSLTLTNSTNIYDTNTALKNLNGFPAICPYGVSLGPVMNLNLRASLNSLKGTSIWKIPYYPLVTGMLSTRLYKSCSSLCLITASKFLSRFVLRCCTSSRMRSASAKWRVEFVGKNPEKNVSES